MAPTRRLSNGRSPLVNQQSQITKYFNKNTHSSTSHTNNNNKEPNPSPSPSPNPSPNPTTPSSHQSMQKKEMKSATTKKTDATSYGKEVLNKGIRVYWPLDQCWYKGYVKGFDELTGKHKVKYDGGEEELYLCKEKIEWVEEKVKKFRRLRKAVVVEEEEEELGEVDDDDDDEKRDESSLNMDADEDDSSNNDWGQTVGKVVSEDELDDMVLEDEDDKVEFESGTPATGSKKRKAGAKEICGSSKMNKRVEKAIPSSDGCGNITEQIYKESKTSKISDSIMTMDASERFRIRKNKISDRVLKLLLLSVFTAQYQI